MGLNIRERARKPGDEKSRPGLDHAPHAEGRHTAPNTAPGDAAPFCRVARQAIRAPFFPPPPLPRLYRGGVCSGDSRRGRAETLVSCGTCTRTQRRAHFIRNILLHDEENVRRMENTLNTPREERLFPYFYRFYIQTRNCGVNARVARQSRLCREDSRDYIFKINLKKGFL